MDRFDVLKWAVNRVYVDAAASKELASYYPQTDLPRQVRHLLDGLTIEEVMSWELVIIDQDTRLAYLILLGANEYDLASVLRELS